MSSAALQSPAGLPPSTHHYTPSHTSSPSREAYHASQTSISNANAANSANSYTNGHGNGHGNGNGALYLSNSSGHMSQTNSPMSSRAALSTPVGASAAAHAAAAAIADQSYNSPSGSSDRRRRHHNPPVAPPRTSSQQQQQSQQPQQPQQPQQQQYHHQQSASMSAVPSSGSSSRRAAASAAVPASDSPRARTRDSRAEDSARRRQQEQEYAQRATTGSGSRSAVAAAAAAASALPIRSHPGATSHSSSHTASREASEILNSTLVSRDEVDIERERVRLAMAQESHHAYEDAQDAVPPPIASAHAQAPEQQVEEGRRGGRSRHDHSRREKQIKFGEYILGNTIGEGEFGKVKLGWKQEGGVQVAIKLIKKDALGNNPTRMAKIKREVNILRQLNHPNIVQLHKMEESEHHYGIVLEYASGGELFDYILNHRYLKDNAARRLFAQLISGVGYLHKKGIVHRDLKLENLLLDRNRNIIITDFGFANSFDPTEELNEDEENNLIDRDYIKRMGFDIVKPNGMRKADLMQTSCGSPCYAAPELVVSDSLYTGRKVDVWSCGVILYAMLAGYLPFDDDPKNPEGDNINLLYKYIVNTPLTFPEYVTPHARDLLRRILVPNPRQRADLFEVARHSWLSEYASVVEFITSTTTTTADIQNIPASAEEDGPMMGRSSSVREAPKKNAVTAPTIGGLTSKPGKIDAESEAALAKQQKENKRRTVQVEYVAPITQTQRGGESQGPSNSGKTHGRSSSQGPVPASPVDKPLPRDPPVSKDAYAKPSRDSRRPPSAHRTTGSAAAVSANAPAAVAQGRASRDGGSRVAAEAAYMSASAGNAARPATGGSMANRASFGQPVPPTVAGTNAHGRIQQPPKSSANSSSRNYVISNPIPQDSGSIGRPSISMPGKFPGYPGQEGEDGASTPGSASGSPRPYGGEGKGHRRSNTLGDITDKLLGRSGSLFGGKSSAAAAARKRPESSQRQSVGMDKASARRYPPVSMANTVAAQNAAAVQAAQAQAAGLANADDQPRASIDSTARQSRRSFSIGLGKKRSGSIEGGSQTSHEKQHSRRFSILPGSFSLKSIGLGGSGSSNSHSHSNSRHMSASHFEQRTRPHLQELNENVQRNPPRTAPYEGGVDGLGGEAADSGGNLSGGIGSDGRRTASRGGRVVLQKNKRMADAYDNDDFSKHADRSGSTGAARRVMDFFRRRSKARGGEE
ncbi:camk camkl kin4 protein kinase [Ophiostoma piceae UAMH 11346]|uniref:non-specific serine/threonine protein kinase n=1 Tax=Ophiostoma piceae (strain UAMH 11346) TaxID=1262450 RepID=S3C9P6_OPHP1|nr:camk camkl kin4 protein kinase [Ophiostoma piceae UAMH 11346]